MCVAWFDHAIFELKASRLVVSGVNITSRTTLVCLPRPLSSFAFCVKSLCTCSVLKFRFYQIPLRRTMTLKQVAERIQSCANVRDVEELTFHSIINDQKKSEKINVLKDSKRDVRLKDLTQAKQAPGEKKNDNFWEFFNCDCPEMFCSIEYDLKATWRASLLVIAAQAVAEEAAWLYGCNNYGRHQNWFAWNFVNCR